MVQIEYLPIVLTGIGIIAAIVYYTLTLRNSNKARKAQLFMGLYDQYRSPDFRKQMLEIRYMDWENNEDFFQKYNYTVNPEAMITINSVAAYFNGIGILLSQGLIDIELVDELLSFVIMSQWEKMEPIILMMRRNNNAPNIYTHFENLYKKIKKKNTA